MLKISIKKSGGEDGSVLRLSYYICMERYITARVTNHFVPPSNHPAHKMGCARHVIKDSRRAYIVILQGDQDGGVVCAP